MKVWIVPRDHRLEEFSMWTFTDLVYLVAGLAYVTTTVTRMTGSTTMGASHIAPAVRLSVTHGTAYRARISIRATSGKHGQIGLFLALGI